LRANGHVAADEPPAEAIRQQALRFGIEAEELQALIPLLSKRELAELDQLLNVWTPQPHQVPPPQPWTLWLMLGGRGSGKTDAMSHYVNAHVMGPPCLDSLPGGHRVAIIAPNLGDAVEACVTGPSGLRAHSPGIKFKSQGGLHIQWPNGAEGKLFGASFPEDVERLRAGGNRCMAWLEELAAWQKLDECYDHMRFGLRLGPHPHAVASTTPKPRKRIKDLLKDPQTAVTMATTAQNRFLHPEVRQFFYDKYAGTRLGLQELEGKLIDDNPDSFWHRHILDRDRVARVPQELKRVVIGVDPSGGEGRENDEQGIIVCGTAPPPEDFVKTSDQLSPDTKHGYVLADYSCKLSPEGWGGRVVQAYLDWKADLVVVESNFGGDMARSVIETAARERGTWVNVQMRNSSRGKAIRAEPVSMLYDQGRVHHVTSGGNALVLLEDEMCTWEPDSAWSPNRLDACVWAMTELLIQGSVGVWLI
jgi:phage terminase large subunit-like protein